VKGNVDYVDRWIIARGGGGGGVPAVWRPICRGNGGVSFRRGGTRSFTRAGGEEGVLSEQGRTGKAGQRKGPASSYLPDRPL